MPIPKISHDIFKGLVASRKLRGDLFMETWDEILEDECLADMFRVLCEDCDMNSPAPEEAQAGVVIGMVYIYMLLKAQIESDELKKQWEL